MRKGGSPVSWGVLGLVCGLLVVGLVVLVVVAVVWDRQHRKTVMAKGETVVAWVVQANNALYEEGTEDYPAQVLVSPDPTADDDFLKDVAERMADLKGARGLKDP